MIKNKTLLFVGLALLLGFSFGRWAAPTKIEYKKEIVTTEKKSTDTEDKKNTDLERNKKMRKIIVEIVRPDGTKETTTRYVENTETKKSTDQLTKTKEEYEKETKEIETKIVENAKSTVHLSALAGHDVTKLTMPQKPSYGGHIQKNILGPITAGLFGLTNGTCGVSLGLSL